MAQPKYIVALIANGELQKAEEYTKNEMERKKRGTFLAAGCDES